MEKPRADLAMPLPVVVDGAVGPDSNYCMGYLNPGASGYGYISTLKLSTGIVSLEGLDPGTEGIVSYDRCEKNDAYIGQINMLTASSFCGVNGAVWGYHLATADEIKKGTLAPMFYQNEGGLEVPVYPVRPLLDCATRLFGVAEQRRFPPMPGAHVICANKNYTSDPSKGTGFLSGPQSRSPSPPTANPKPIFLSRMPDGLRVPVESAFSPSSNSSTVLCTQ